MTQKELTQEQRDTLLATLKTRFENNMHRHEGITWEDVQAKLEKNDKKLWSLHEMERTEGEPDVVAYDSEVDVYTFYDCSKESPKGRRSVCYDLEGLKSRKKHQPEHTAMDMATEMGINILNEAEYRALQELGEFDLKTSTWIQTPEEIRKLGGALFMDRRYDHVFLYHNGASSYYASRGFRGSLHI